jgi:glycosyltransferase involved in cell wall biosynthesis
LTTIIPAYNEGDSIGITISQLLKSLAKQRLHYEIIVIDDGSLDGTGIIAREHGADIVIRNMNNLGKGAAIASGVAEASGSIIVLMDADGTYNPEDIPHLISPILQGEADVVIGSRFPTEGVSPLHTLGNYIISRFNRVLLGTKTNDAWSGLKAFKTDKLKELMKDQLVTGNEFDVEVLYFAHKKGYRIVEMALRTRLRKSVGYSRSKSRLHSLKMGLRILWRILKMRAGQD